MLKGNPNFQQSEQTAAIVATLRGVNQDISYVALSKAVGFRVTGATSSLISARRVLESAENIVFDTVRGQGLIRLDDAGKVASTERHARTIGRTARRGRKRLNTVENFSALKPKEQLAATLRATQFEFAQQAVSTKKPSAPPKVEGLDIAALLQQIKKTG
jgi:hypothetical protein